jgi:Poly(ADP-ribose) polymerase catalytic domain
MIINGLLMIIHMETIIFIEPNLLSQYKVRAPYVSPRAFERSPLSAEEVKIFNFKKNKVVMKLSERKIENCLVFEGAQSWIAKEKNANYKIAAQNIEQYYRICVASKQSKFLLPSSNAAIYFYEDENAVLLTSTQSNEVIGYFERVLSNKKDNMNPTYIIGDRTQTEYIHTLLKKLYAKSQKPKQFNLPVEIQDKSLQSKISDELIKQFDVKILGIDKNQISLQGFRKLEAIEYINKIAVLIKEKEYKNELQSKDKSLEQLTKSITQLNIETEKNNMELLKLRDTNNFPKYWNITTGAPQVVQLFKLKSTSKEYTNIANHILKTVPCQIISIIRIQNPWIWRLYNAELNNFHDFGIPINESYFFHGTYTTHPSKIYNSEVGLDVLYSNDGLWGKGVYLAAQASYSDKGGYVYVENGVKHLLYVRAILGDTVKMPPTKLLEFPLNPKTKRKFDSLCEQESDERPVSVIYVFKRSVQTYPEYVISYTDS